MNNMRANIANADGRGYVDIIDVVVMGTATMA